jgi:hypothetical protein
MAGLDESRFPLPTILFRLVALSGREPITKEQEMNRTFTSFFLVLGVAAIALCGTPRVGARNRQHSEQVIFSGVGSCTQFGNVGFWIWCESDSNNPYQGECNGAMYVYSQGITKHVDGDIEEDESTGAYTMTVQSRDGILSANLTNVPPPKKGPKNTVEFTVSIPAGSCSGSSTNAVVNVTGPPE